MTSIKIAADLTELRDFLTKTIEEASLELTRIKISEQDHWGLHNGVLAHKTGGFFQVAGAVNDADQENHLVLYQPQSALTGLILFRDAGEILVLVQARVEPGNTKEGQYGPTIQSTAANFLQLHGGRPTTYADMFRCFHPAANALGTSTHFDLGKRYFHKCKLHNYLEARKPIPTLENMIWAPLRVLVDALSVDAFLNTDLRSLLAVFDWDLFTGPDIDRGSHSPDLGHSNGGFAASVLGPRRWQLTELEDLQGWELTDKGVADRCDSGVWVDMFRVSCGTREVSEWSQPLMCAANRGLVALVVREVNGRCEFLISDETEFGISGQHTLLPSFVSYPGENHDQLERFKHGGEVMAEILQSEEGGRFYRNESLYRLIMAGEDIQLRPNHRWVGADTLKRILNSSCKASIQLRCACSMALPYLNPGTLGRQPNAGARIDDSCPANAAPTPRKQA